jgi:DNA polymerase-3 subunit epsilon
MREIVLDTETTGLDPALGHRIIEVGAVELMHHVPTGQRFHRYVNPERDVPVEALAVHGLTAAFLADKPAFADLAAELLEFLGDAKLVIHNAEFDFNFLNAELSYLGLDPIDSSRIVDTLELARRRHAASPNSLDALCKRYDIDLSRRERHGALLDAELLAEVYIELIGGRQTELSLSSVAGAGLRAAVTTVAALVRRRALPPRLTEEEKAAHRRFVDELGPSAVWKTLSGWT